MQEIYDRKLNHAQKKSFEMSKMLKTMDEEIEDLQEQVEQKKRAPISKKRESDARLT